MPGNRGRTHDDELGTAGKDEACAAEATKRRTGMANRGDGRLHTEVTLAEFICLMLFLLSRSQSGPWGRRQAELCPQLRPHHRKTGERLIVKSVLQKLFRFFLKLSGVRRVRFLLLWQWCDLQRGSPKGRRFRQRESAPPRRRGRASLAKPSFRALRSECSDNRDISIEKAPAFPGRGGACCLESRFLAAASAKNVPLSFAVDFCISALNMLTCG